MDGSPPDSPVLGFSRQEHWSGLPFPSPMHESEKWKWSRSVASDPHRPHGLQPSRLLHPWDFPGKSTGVGCHCLLQTQHCRSTILQFFFFFFLSRETVVQRFKQDPVSSTRDMGIYLWVSLEELRLPPRWRMLNSDWAQASWNTALLLHSLPIRRKSHTRKPSPPILPIKIYSQKNIRKFEVLWAWVTHSSSFALK